MEENLNFKSWGQRVLDDLNYGSFVDKNAMVNIYGTRTQVFCA